MSEFWFSNKNVGFRLVKKVHTRTYQTLCHAKSSEKGDPLYTTGMFLVGQTSCTIKNSVPFQGSFLFLVLSSVHVYHGVPFTYR